MSTSSGEKMEKEREYHHGDLRKALVEAAVELLKEKSINDLSLREVARMAGVSAAAPYRHFPSKEALLAAVAGWGFQRLSETFVAVQATDPVEALVDQGEAYIRFASEWPNVYRTMFGGWVKRMDDYPELVEVANGSFEILVGSIVAAGLGSDDPFAQAVVVWSFVHGYATLRLDGMLEWEAEDGQPKCPSQHEVLTRFVRGMVPQ